MGKARKPKILVFDIETSPMEVFAWSPKTEYIHKSFVKKHRSILSWAAKWLGRGGVMYEDNRHAKNPRDDKKLLGSLWKLLDEAEMVVTKNGKRFDQKVVNGRFAINDLGVPSPYLHEDIEQLFRRHFDLPYYSLEFLCEVFDTKWKKRTHAKFPGVSLQVSCLEGNPAAWREMELYNKADVLATEELRSIITPWGSTVNVAPLVSSGAACCEGCGSPRINFRGTAVNGAGRYRKYQCQACGRWGREKGAGKNLLKKA